LKSLTGELVMRDLRRVFTLILISVASYAAAAGDETKQSFQPPSTRTVSGTEIVHFKSGPVPVDLSTTTIAALVPNESGGYKVLTGNGTSSGTFTIPNVPSGFYLLQIGAVYVWTSNTVVDADSIADYRSDIVQADPSTTTVTLDLTNLHSWQQTDLLELFCPNNTAFDFFPGTVGETTFTGTFPYSGALSVGSEGDQYYIAQLITQNLGSYAFTGLGRYLAPPKFTQAQGSNTPIDGRLRTIARNHQFEANIDGADIGAQVLAANPGAVLDSAGIFLDVYPGSFAHGQNTSTPDLVIYSAPPAPFITTNSDLGPISYGNPYPSKWPLYATYSWTAQTNYLAPGATNGAPMLTEAFGSTLTLPTSTSPIKPLAGVVSSPSVNHKNFFTDQSGIGTAPTLRWSPPSEGSANNYVVRIYQLFNNAGNTVISLIAGFRTQGKSLIVPPGVLSSGQAYFFLIQSDYIPGVNFAKTPFMNGSTSALAQVTSGVMQP
jgi:hypothetical protein